MNGRPDFIVIGAMKCATTTLHEQLARQPGVFMTRRKEPNYFSDDDVYARGLNWYSSLFADAPAGSLRGESSVRYTNLPTHPRTLGRLRTDLGPDLRFVYVMRHPISRLVSHYIHAWSKGVIRARIDRAVDELPEMIDYGRYAMQLRPWLEVYGSDRVLPVFFERLVSHPQEQLERIGRFLDAPVGFRWREELGAGNVSSRRERHSALRETLRGVPGARDLLHALLPEKTGERIRGWLWRMDKRPELAEDVQARVAAIFDEDLAELGRWLGLDLGCRTFHALASSTSDVRWAPVIQEICRQPSCA